MDRTIVYVIGLEHTRVLHIEFYQPAELLLDARNIRGVGLAGSDILFYSKCLENFYGHCTGLYALDMRTGKHQEFAAKGHIRAAVGDGQHVDWLAGDDLLYLASLDLKSPDSDADANAACPTVYAYARALSMSKASAMACDKYHPPQ